MRAPCPENNAEATEAIEGKSIGLPCIAVFDLQRLYCLLSCLRLESRSGVYVDSEVTGNR
jgi:hypothetical protein